MEPADFDLNLLRSLEALLDEVSVTRAAERMCVTQPAMSGALRRLREHFGDDLLVRSGRRMELTPRGQALRISVSDLISDIRLAVEARPTFDPKTARDGFSISISDYGALVLMPEVLRLLSVRAPGVSCNVRSLSSATFAQLGNGQLDFILTSDHWGLYPDNEPDPDVRTAELFQDDFVCVVDEGTCVRDGRLTLREYCALPHNSVAFDKGIESLVEIAWDRAGLDIRVVAKAPDFSSLVLMVPGTALVATAQRRLCEVLVSAFPLRIVECPVDIPALRETMVWHRRTDEAPAHIFMREVFIEAAASVAGDGSQSSPKSG